MKTVDFIREHRACRKGAKWALSISEDMADVWDAMINQNRHDWLLWAAIRPGVFSDTVVRKLACRFVRETPIGDGTVWDLLEDERSRKAVEMAERYADGKATEAELAAAYEAAYAAADAAASSAWTAADAAARAAAHIAAYAAARADKAAAGASRDFLAAWAADAAADAAAYDAAESVRDAAYAAAIAVAHAAQVRMVAELGNPFKGACP